MTGLASSTMTSGALTAALARIEPSNTDTGEPGSARPRSVTRA